jgi:hypothetical protein
MRTTPSIGQRVRGAALFALGAVAVHQLRYLLAYGGGVHAAAEHRHGYLEMAIPVLIGATIGAIAASILVAATRRRLPSAFDSAATTERAALFALGLLVVYLVQELAEGLLLSGHTAAFAGVLGAGGWLALPLAIAFGALAAFAGEWLDRAELRLGGAFRPAPRRAPRRAPAPAVVHLRVLASRPLAFGLSRRPPPVLSSG